MARTFSRAEQTYPAGVYGPFSVDGFAKGDAEALEATMSVVGWPNLSPLMIVELAWNSGGKATFDVSGEQRGADGNLMPSVAFRFSIPRVAGVKRDVSGGTIKVTTFAPITTALQLRAV